MKTVLAGFTLIAFLTQFGTYAAQTQYDSGDPTADEQQMLEVINRARANPAAEGTRLGIDINEGLPAGQTAKVQPPLAMNKILVGTARAHSMDMYTRKFFAHVNPDGLDPFQRMKAAGYSFFSAGENIAAGSSDSASGLEDLLMVDKGEPGRGHRQNLLNTDPSVGVYQEIGIGYFAGPTPITGSSTVNGLQNFLTQDFGTPGNGPFLLGVVYTDKNSNNFYDSGEGVSGVTITPDSGSFFAISGTAGGYAFPIGKSGTVTLTASGGPLSSPITKQVTLTGTNVKVDFNITAGSGGGGGTAPSITSPLSANGTANADFTYTVTASGTQPISFTATGLPDGLILSGSTISGKTTLTGQFMIALTATNAQGKDSKTMVLTIAAGTATATVTKHTFTLNFKFSTGKDALDVKFFSADFINAADGQTVSLQIGSQTFDSSTLSHFKGTGSIGKFTLNAKGGTIEYVALNASLQSVLLPFGAVNMTTTATVNVPISLVVNGTTYSTTIPFAYKAIMGKTGKGS